MRLSIPDNYSREDIEREVNRIISKLEEQIKSARKLNTITSRGAEPPAVEENEIFVYRDGSTKKLIIRDEGEEYDIDLTKVT